MAERVLVVSYAYPPLAAPESILSAKAAHGLLDAGFEVDVVCLEPSGWRRRDPSLVDYASEVNVRRVREPLWLPAVQPHHSLRRYPDAMRFVRRRALRAVSGSLERYDALLTWSQWHSVHLLGLDLKARRPALPWTAHFSDPWVDNPLLPLRGMARRVAQRMEREVIAAADVVEFTTRETASQTMARHPAATARATVVPHAFDRRLYPVDLPAERGLVVRYIGSFYAGRSPDILFVALERLLATAPTDLDGVRFELVGDVPRAMRRATSLPDGLVRFVPPVDYRSSLSLMRTADLLLVVDAPATRSVYLPSKLVDYAGSGRPILGITPPGESAELVVALGGTVADPADPDAVARALSAALASVRDGGPVEWGNPAVRARYDLASVTAARAAVLFEGAAR